MASSPIDSIFGVRRVRLLLAVALALLSLLVGGLCPPEAAQSLIRHGGYYFSLIAVVAFLAALGGILCRYRSASCNKRKIAWSLGIVLTGSWLLFAHADFGYKMAMDDYILVSTAKNLHESREVVTTTEVESFGAAYRPAEVYIDKRPWLYPFVVASLHDVFGYHSANPFIANALIAVATLGLGFGLGYAFAGLWGGALSVLLWVSLPLLAQNATGGGMELLNLCMLQAVLLLAVYYWQNPDALSESALSLAAVLLTYSRYESGIFIIPVAILILMGWWRKREVILSWGSVAAAPLLSIVLLQTKLYAASESSWELTGAASRPFHWEHLLSNMPHALNFFFSYDDTLANSLLLSLLGGVCLLAFFFLLRTEAKRYMSSLPIGMVTAVFAGFFILQLALVVSFHAGRLDSPFVSRYALLFHALLVLVILAMCEHIGRQWERVWPWMIGLTLVFLIAFTLPMNAKALFSKRNFAVREQYWLEQVSQQSLTPHSIIIDRFSVPWSLRDWVAVGPEFAVAYAGGLVERVRQGQHAAIYFVERLHYTDGEFVPDLQIAASLHKSFEMVLVEERSFRPFSLTRVYRIRSLLPQ